jgi:hypothetical protein
MRDNRRPMPSQIIHLHRDAPAKPPPGAPCNGCGVCCAAETCPAARLLFLRRHGPCPALAWQDGRYRCGLLTAPQCYLRWLPDRFAHAATRVFARSIAAGAGCDSTVEVDEPNES